MKRKKTELEVSLPNADFVSVGSKPGIIETFPSGSTVRLWLEIEDDKVAGKRVEAYDGEFCMTFAGLTPRRFVTMRVTSGGTQIEFSAHSDVLRAIQSACKWALIIREQDPQLDAEFDWRTGKQS